MSGSRIKTMVIAALLLINVIFLTVIIVDAVAGVRSERQAIENACAVLRHSGIEINPDDVMTAVALRTMRTARGDEAEAAIARALLGPTVMTDQGIIYLYENVERGIAEFFSVGDFKILLNEGVITNANGTLRTVQRLLRDMKLETAEPILSGEPGNETVTVAGAYRGKSIFNCVIEFIFNGENLEIVKGRYVTNIEVAEDGTEISSAGTTLLTFLAWVKREDVECARIDSVEAGYQHRAVGSFGESVIAPAWLITADSGRYILDDATGEIWQLGASG